MAGRSGDVSPALPQCLLSTARISMDATRLGRR
jgi:hypothetical protein